ncbi:MAG: hypothetical protein ABGW69_01095 [Nanoarchaeota archaeon]
MERDLYLFTVYTLISIKEQIMNPVQLFYTAEESKYSKEFAQFLREMKNEARIYGIINTLYKYYKKYGFQNLANLAVILKSGDIEGSSYMLKKVTTLEKITEKTEGSFGEIIVILIILSFLSIFIPYMVKLIFKKLDYEFLVWTFYFFLFFNLSVAFPLLTRIFQRKRHLRYILLAFIIAVHYFGLFSILLF